MHQVRSAIQASPQELAEGLDAEHIVLVDGYARMVGTDYLADEVLRLLLAHVEMNAFPADEVPLALMTSALQAAGVPHSIAKAVLSRWYARPNESADQEEEVSVTLSMPAIARTLGLHTLQRCARQGPRIPLEDFMEAWQAVLGTNWAEEAQLPLLEVRHWSFCSSLSSLT